MTAYFSSKLGVWMALICLIQMAFAEERVALVIGNGAYHHSVRLENPARDATEVARRFERGGYRTILLKDADVRTMRRSLLDFSREHDRANQAVFFYAGHGLEVDGKNHLVPIDAELQEEADLRGETVGLEEVLEAMKGVRLKIVVLDCCRDNPFATDRSWMRRRSSGGGLAEVRQDAMAPGTVLVFSGHAGKAVPDGQGRHSPFTEGFLKVLDERGADPVTQVLGALASRKYGGQSPWLRFDDDGLAFSEFTQKAMLPLAQKSDPIVTSSIESDTKEQPDGTKAPDVGKFTGSWKVIEEVDAAHGGYRIEWNYTFSSPDGGWLHVLGRKALVNGKNPTDGEKAAWVEGDLKWWDKNGNDRSGEVIETNHRAEKIRGQWTLTFAPDGASFVGKNMEDGKLVSTLRGLKKE
jgi:hypothetical protein